MKLPLETTCKYGEYPSDGSCYLCCAKPDFINKGTVSLDLAALLFKNSKFTNGGPSPLILNELTIQWHSEYGILDPDDHEVMFIPILKNIPQGCATVHFCSSRCLRQFFNQMMDEVDSRIESFRIQCQQQKAQH
jgi:hypothetical protein